MKKLFLSLSFLSLGAAVFGQNPGLILSEIMPNPAGTDSPFEWVELRATAAIDFAVTPYTVIASNNGTATANGWIASGSLSYAFAITSGTVNPGDVVYVGGSTMAPTGTKLRIINTGTTPGDMYGSAASGGVIGNGGANADGIGVFNLPVASITNSSVPVDALFYGTGLGTAVLNGGADGLQLPVNDLYAGGKLQTNSFIAPDPGSDQTIVASGFYNTATNSWGVLRSWSVGTFNNNNASTVAIGTSTPLGSVSFSAVSQSIVEGANATITVNMSNANSDTVAVLLSYSVYSDATLTTDFTMNVDTLFIPRNTNGPQTITLTSIDDALAERTEKVIVKLTPLYNANLGTNSFQIIYIKDNDYQTPVANNELKLNLLSSFSNGAEGTNSSEIVAFDPSTDKLYIANSIGGKIDIVDFSNPATPVLTSSIAMAPYGNINSLTVHNGTLVAAIENSDPQLNGAVVFFDASGNYISQVAVGAMPDMITFNNDYTKVLVACEGEPKADYTIDPEGQVGIIDMTPGAANITAANVTMVNFQSFIGQEATLRAQGIRIFGPGSNAAQDFEPEYITISEDNSKAFVTLQENNAIAVINITTGTVDQIHPLGSMNYANGNNGLDASDQTSGVFIGSAPIKGLFMPDAIAHATIAGTEYLFTANEGDAREYAAYSEITRLSSANLDASIVDQNILKSPQFLGRINVTKASGDTDNDGDIDDIHVFGTRSFTIWNAQTGALVFDSKDLFEQLIASHPTLSGLFNASNSAGAATSKNRSDDKGPEPEGVATAFINGNHYLFVSLERVGGVMLFNIDNPATPTYVGYYNNRDVATNGPDRGAEGIITIKKEDSPNGKDLVILANEISSTLSVFEINTCVDLAGATLTVPSDSICAGDTVTLSVPGNMNSTIQWLKDDQVLAAQNGTNLPVTTSGEYRVFVSNSALACADTTLAQMIQVVNLPAVQVGTDVQVCEGASIVLNATTTETPTWNNAVQNNVSFVPTVAGTYIASVTNAFGCMNSDSLEVTINALPSVTVGADVEVCAGSSIQLNATSTEAPVWNNGVQNNVSFIPTIPGNYIATVTNTAGCSDSDTLMLTINALPGVVAGSDVSVCQGATTTLTATGAPTLTWNNGVTNGQAYTPTLAGNYIVHGTDANGCENWDTLVITILNLPVIDLGADSTICQNQLPITIQGPAGMASYAWNNGFGQATTTITQAGTYELTVTGQNGCTAMDNIAVIVEGCLGVDEFTDQAIVLYPNPTTNHFNVQGITTETQVIVYSMTGQKVYETNITPTNSSVYTGTLTSGNYMVHLISTNSQTHVKLQID